MALDHLQKQAAIKTVLFRALQDQPVVRVIGIDEPLRLDELLQVVSGVGALMEAQQLMARVGAVQAPDGSLMLPGQQPQQ